ncbi:hypothetical protein GIS00_13065 [Nakamurella sp. YIM 132087]|uniref:DUF3592 domain-containing protein n=1 Tax=Nakamurella alba TaxID=2665158 RepID=A0A7K1FLD2_9ACTN|nr:hypothetical protein [Nakamurella alba]MTD14870.1 hypothetical protein [Nakamurella alba]
MDGSEGDPAALTARAVDLGVRASRRRSDLVMWSCAGLAVFMALLVGVVLMAAPLARARAFGTAVEQDARVSSVVISEDQSGKKRGRGPRWDVTVDLGTRSAVGQTRSDDPPYAEGDVIRVWTAAGTDEIALPGRFSPSGTWAGLAFLGLASVVSAVIAVVAGRGRNRFRTVLSERDPVRVTVLSVESRRRSRDLVVTYRAVSGSQVPGSVILRPARQASPAAGVLLDIWTAQENGRGPFLVRDPRREVWWTASGLDPVPPISS